MRAAAAVLLAALAPAAARAGGGCAPAAEVAALLARNWGEARRFAGVEPRGVLVELWLSAAGTWTILIVSADGTACLAAAGEAGALLPPPAPAPAGEPG